MLNHNFVQKLCQKIGETYYFLFSGKIENLRVGIQVPVVGSPYFRDYEYTVRCWIRWRGRKIKPPPSLCLLNGFKPLLIDLKEEINMRLSEKVICYTFPMSYKEDMMEIMRSQTRGLWTFPGRLTRWQDYEPGSNN
jgi:hypothetical protein